jgi:hypothetical protein
VGPARRCRERKAHAKTRHAPRIFPNGIVEKVRRAQDEQVRDRCWHGRMSMRRAGGVNA